MQHPDMLWSTLSQSNTRRQAPTYAAQTSALALLPPSHAGRIFVGKTTTADTATGAFNYERLCPTATKFTRFGARWDSSEVYDIGDFKCSDGSTLTPASGTTLGLPYSYPLAGALNSTTDAFTSLLVRYTTVFTSMALGYTSGSSNIGTNTNAAGQTSSDVVPCPEGGHMVGVSGKATSSKVVSVSLICRNPGGCM